MSVLTWSRSNLHALIPHTAHITHPRAHTEGQSTKHDPQPSVASAVRTRLSSGPAHTLHGLHTRIRSSHPYRVHRRHSSAQRAPQPPAACRLLHAFTRLMCTPYPSCLLHLPAPDRHAQNLKVVPSHSHSCRPPLPSAARRSLATSLAASLARGEGHAAGGCDAHSLVCVLRVRDVASLGVLRRACRALRVKLLAVLVVPAWVF